MVSGLFDGEIFDWEIFDTGTDLWDYARQPNSGLLVAAPFPNQRWGVDSFLVTHE